MSGTSSKNEGENKNATLNYRMQVNSHHDDEQLLTWVPRLRRYARALVGNRDDADDLVQDTLERAWAKSAMWQGINDMRAWLFGVMHNLHVDNVRRPKLHTVLLDEDTPELPVASTQTDRLALLDLQAALHQLPMEQREIILLIALEDLSYAEVAATLGIPIGSVMSRLSRGRERLRCLMEGRPDPVRLKVVK